jgi:hypothetical protein
MTPTTGDHRASKGLFVCLEACRQSRMGTVLSRTEGQIEVAMLYIVYHDTQDIVGA